MKKRIAIILIAVMVIVSVPFTAFGGSNSTYEDYANSLAPLGVFVGTDAGFELERPPTRIEGLIMLVRLLGAEDSAMAMKGKTIPFKDVPKWASGYVAYAYENGLTNGISSTLFGSTNTIEAKAYITFLLRSLGYNDTAGDFSYANALHFGKSVGLLNGSTHSNLSTSTFLRAHIAKTSYDALKFRYRGTDTLLINKLMADGKIKEDVGNQFIKTILTDPVSLTDYQPVNNGRSIEENVNSIVMLTVETSQGSGLGSGAILTSNGEIVTNYHVIEGAQSITVMFNDGTTYTGNVYIQDYDKNLDLAIIKINKTGLSAVKVGDSSSLRQGDAVTVIGSPYGLFNTVTEGIVSAIRSDAIQVSAAINPGNSGGGVFNGNGELIGIATAKVENADNLGFAIPSDKFSRVTAKNMVLVSATFADETSPEPEVIINPPTNIRIIRETDDTVYINWNSVPGADYYYVYHKESWDDTYWYDEEDGRQMRFDYYSDYSLEFYDLEPGTTYNIIVTSVKNGVESQDSQVFTFTKGYGKGYIYYEDNYGVPDYGKVTNTSLYNFYIGSGYSYYYAFSKSSVDTIEVYNNILKNNGFVVVDSWKNSDGHTMLLLENKRINKQVAWGLVELSGKPKILVYVSNIK